MMMQQQRRQERNKRNRRKIALFRHVSSLSLSWSSGKYLPLLIRLSRAI